ncbi:MAG: cytochrome c [Gemmatimonadaceae bacterium]|nr:cytochrome c [Gemmatimonadaceae bacterium]NUR19028.1 cytochrome c [Gemmatimonadaceae bacterium]
MNHQTMKTVDTPRWRGALILAALGAALALGGTANAQATSAPAQPRTGAQIFSSTCAACHQAQGEGTPTYPPLAGSEWVNGAESRLVRIVMHGLQGDVEVQGQVYNGAMPAWGTTLSDAEIAAVLTYIRASFGNQSLPVTTATVAQTREANAGRKTPWTIPELLLIKVGDRK